MDRSSMRLKWQVVRRIQLKRKDTVSKKQYLQLSLQTEYVSKHSLLNANI